MRSLRGWLGSKLKRDKDGVSSGEGPSVVREREAFVAAHSLKERALSLEERWREWWRDEGRRMLVSTERDVDLSLGSG